VIMKVSLLIIGLQLTVFLLKAQTASYLPSNIIGQRAPNFETVTLDGDSVSLSGLKGKVVVLSFWHLRCGACWLEVPDFNKLRAEYDGKIEVISVTLDAEKALWERFSKTDKGYKMNRAFNGNSELTTPYYPMEKQLLKRTLSLRIQLLFTLIKKG